MTTIGIIMQTTFHWLGYILILGSAIYAIKQLWEMKNESR